MDLKKDNIRTARHGRSNIRKEISNARDHEPTGITKGVEHPKIGASMGEEGSHSAYQRTEERDGFYCGDAIMFYPDASDCNGDFPSPSPSQGRRPGICLPSSSPEKPHKCVQCGAGFRQRSHLKAHIRTHTGEKPFGCEVCGKTFARLDSTVRHMKTHAAEGQGTQRAEKARSFSTPVKPARRKGDGGQSSGKRHIKDRTPKEKPYKCFECGMAFRQQCHLKVHTRIHTGEKPFDCEVCGKTFGRKYSALRHMKTHNEDSLHMLNHDFITTSASSSIANLLPKLERVQGCDKPFRCDQCTAAFTQRSHLRNHLRTHTGEKPYGCEACGKTFSRKYSAMRHMRTHTGEKRYKCEFCGNSYSQRFHLRDHMRTHTGEKPFNCPVCEKAFSRKDLAVRHLRTHSDSTAKMFDFADEPE